MDGFIPNILKYLILFANLIFFIAGIIIFGISIWVAVDTPQFLDLFDKAKDVAGEEVDGLDLNIYNTSTYIFIGISAIVVIISFFGCCGAWKESKCMLGTYFTFVLLLFILLLTGGILAYSGDLKNTIKTPLLKTVAKYDDSATDGKAAAYKKAWNSIQKDMKCCGVVNAKDWEKNVTAPKWDPSTANKPEGCCMWMMVDAETKDISKDTAKIETCRRATVLESALTSDYFWDGCFTKFEDKVEGNKSVVVWCTSISAIVLVLTLLITLGLCMKVD